MLVWLNSLSPNNLSFWDNFSLEQKVFGIINNLSITSLLFLFIKKKKGKKPLQYEWMSHLFLEKEKEKEKNWKALYFTMHMLGNCLKCCSWVSLLCNKMLFLWVEGKFIPY